MLAEYLGITKLQWLAVNWRYPWITFLLNLLQLAVTIMASFSRQNGCIAAHKVKMSLDYHRVEVLRKNTEKYAAHRPECVSDMVCDKGHRVAPCSWIRHGLRELPGNPLSICHLHAWPKPWKMTGGGALRNTVRNTPQISRVHRGDRCMQLCHLWLQCLWCNTVIHFWLAWMDGHEPHLPANIRKEGSLFLTI